MFRYARMSYVKTYIHLMENYLFFYKINFYSFIEFCVKELCIKERLYPKMILYRLLQVF